MSENNKWIRTNFVGVLPKYRNSDRLNIGIPRMLRITAFNESKNIYRIHLKKQTDNALNLSRVFLETIYQM